MDAEFHDKRLTIFPLNATIIAFRAAPIDKTRIIVPAQIQNDEKMNFRISSIFDGKIN